MKPRCWGVVALLGAAACGGRGAPASLTIFAASSLTEAFAAMEAAFEAKSPGTDVTISTGGSQVLRLQIEHGAPAHGFASADAVHVDALEGAGFVRQRVPFATNALVVVVPRSNPAGITSLDDLPRAQRLVLGTPEVPIGRYARSLLAAVGDDFARACMARVVSTESNVRLILAKVELDEADAAIVYRSDVTNSRDVIVIEVPTTLGVSATYHAATLQGAPPLADAWLALLLDDDGQAILARHGLQGPDVP